jgi:ABC-type amino acid transport substrate-binding protein
MRSRRALLGALLALCANLASPQANVASPPAAADALEQARQDGSLSFAVYNDFPPFSDEGKGIDIDLAHALAAKLGLKARILAFDAGENMEDDLRNMVWKGHYLGYPTAQVMLHVPVDRVFMARNEQVEIFAPYFREQIALARNLERLPSDEGLGVFARESIGVESETVADAYLLSAEGGRLRPNVMHYKSTAEAAAALKAGEVSAVMGQRSELETALAGAAGFELTPVVAAGLSQSGWVLGLAVKREERALAHALKAALDSLEQTGALERIFARHGAKLNKP